MATYYIDPFAESNDAFDGGFGEGFLRPNWASFTLAAGDLVYCKGNTISITDVGILLTGTNTRIHTYGVGLHTIDCTNVTNTSYGIRAQGTNNSIKNIRLLAPTACQSGLQLGSGATSFTAQSFILQGPGKYGTFLTNSGINIGTANTFLIEDFEIYGFNSGIGGGWPSSTTGTQIIQRGKISALSGLSPTDSDGITIGGTFRDHGYLTYLRQLNISGFYENGIDLVGGAHINVVDVSIDSPANPEASGMLFGASGGSVSEHRIKRVSSIGGRVAFHTRGGAGNTLESCFGKGTDTGLTIAGGTGPNNQNMINCTFVGDEGGACRIGLGVTSTGHTFKNTFFSSKTVRGVTVDLNCSASFQNCASNMPLTSGSAGTVIDNGNNLENIVPDLNHNFIPKTSSPLFEAGVFSTYFLDKNKTQWHNPPSIGAYEYVAERADAGTRGVR